jgi:hypothetical protein
MTARLIFYAHAITVKMLPPLPVLSVIGLDEPNLLLRPFCIVGDLAVF